MIKKIIKSSLLVYFFFSLSHATITNFTFSKDTSLSNENVSYAYESNSDTVINEIWLEITDDTLLTQEDKHLFSFAMIDNNAVELFENGLTIMPDNDPAPQKYLFGPIVSNLPSGRFYVVLKDRSDSCYKSFIIIPPIPQIKIKGKVTVPEEFSCKNIWVLAYVKNGERVFQSLTNSMGEYIINIDSETVANYDSIRIEVNKEFLKDPSLFSMPSYLTISLKYGDVDSVNFSLVKANSIITGKVTNIHTNEPIEGISVLLFDLNYNNTSSTSTDKLGNYIIGVDSGSYILKIYSYNWENGYMTPPDTLLTIGRNDTQTVDFKLSKCDTFLYVGIRKDGMPYVGNFGIEARSIDKKLITYSNISNSLNKIYVVKNSKYDIYLTMGREKDTIPNGYILENNRIEKVSPGDTIYFDFIKPGCVIRGKIKDSSGIMVDSLGNIRGISNCIIRVIEALSQGGTVREYISKPKSDGSYICYVKPGTYNITIDFTDNINSYYMKPTSEIFYPPLTLNLGDTIEKNITLLPKDTFIYVNVKYYGAKSRLKLLMSAVGGKKMSTSEPESFIRYETLQEVLIGYDTLGRKEIVVPIGVSRYLSSYNIFILFGIKGYDSLAIGDTIKEGNFKLAQVGDTVVFEIYNSSVKTTSFYESKNLLFEITNVKIKEKILITFTVPFKTNVKFQIFDIRGKEITSVKNKDYEKGRYTISINNTSFLPTGYYIVRMKWNNGQIVKKFSVVNK